MTRALRNRLIGVAMVVVPLVLIAIVTGEPAALLKGLAIGFALSGAVAFFAIAFAMLFEGEWPWKRPPRHE